jgi:hypothetical protein
MNEEKELDIEAAETRWDCQQHHWDKGLTAEGRQFMDEDAPTLFAQVRELRAALECANARLGESRATVEELRASEAVMAQQMSHWLEVGKNATDAETRRCLGLIESRQHTLSVEVDPMDANTFGELEDLKRWILAEGESA